MTDLRLQRIVSADFPGIRHLQGIAGAWLRWLSPFAIHPVFAGEVSGVDLRQPLSSDEVAAIEAGMDRYAVLAFTTRPSPTSSRSAFTRNFGEIENSAGGNITKPHEQRLNPLMNDVSNLGRTMRRWRATDRRRLFNLGNQLWHSDSSFPGDPGEILAAVGPGRRQKAATPNSPICAPPMTRSTTRQRR